MFTLLPVTETFTLATDVIAKQGTYDEIMFWRQTCERLIHDYADSIKALFLAKENVYVGMPYPLYDIFYALTFKSIYGKVLITSITGEENHLSNTFLIFINMIHQHLHIESLLNGLELFC